MVPRHVRITNRSLYCESPKKLEPLAKAFVEEAKHLRAHCERCGKEISLRSKRYCKICIKEKGK